MNDAEIAAGFAEIKTELVGMRGDIRDLQDHVKVTNGTVAALKEQQIRADERAKVASETEQHAAQVAATAAAKATVKTARRAPAWYVFNAAIAIGCVGLGGFLNHLFG